MTAQRKYLVRYTTEYVTPVDATDPEQAVRRLRAMVNTDGVERTLRVISVEQVLTERGRKAQVTFRGKK